MAMSQETEQLIVSQLGKTLQEFFSIANFEAIMKKTGKTHIIVAIDECHDYFPAGFMDKDIYSFFAFHGHLGLDVILMTQGIQSMSRMFNPLLETIVKVTPRSRQVLNNFSYSYTDLKGRFLYSKSLPKKATVFGAYKSFRHDEQNKPKNAVYHWLVITVCIFVGAGLLFKFALSTVNNKGKEAAAKTQTVPKTTSNVLPPSPQPVFKPMTSIKRVPIPTITPNASTVAISSLPSPAPIAMNDLPRVLGYVGDTNGTNQKYLLSNGQIVSTQRRLSIGDIFIK